MNGSNNATEWCAELAKPFFAPPSWVFGPVWAALYLVIAISFGYVLVQCLRRKLPVSVLLPFLLNLVFNAAYSPIQFGLRNNRLASADILVILPTLMVAPRRDLAACTLVRHRQHSVSALGGICDGIATQHHLAEPVITCRGRMQIFRRPVFRAVSILVALTLLGISGCAVWRIKQSAELARQSECQRWPAPQRCGLPALV